MRRAVFACFISLVMVAGLALAEDNRSDTTGTTLKSEKHAPPGSEDGYFSAEDYENLKQNYDRKDNESKTVIQTGTGRKIMIRERQTDEGVHQVQILDTRPGKSPDIILVPRGK